MKGLPDHPKEYFDKFSTNPVPIKPFDPRSRQVAENCLDQVKTLLAGLDVELSHRGSTRFEIAGKGDIELGVFPSEEDWSEVLTRLESRCGKAGNVEENYVRFNSALAGYEIEIIVLKGDRAEVDRMLTEYLLRHPELLKEYERLKRKYGFSRREYQIRKDRFFRRVVAEFPEDYRFHVSSISDATEP
jgi:GrpB-like predicted nucleotidyltransferase (UPF0157 family)